MWYNPDGIRLTQTDLIPGGNTQKKKEPIKVPSDYANHNINTLSQMLARCITIPLICLSLVKSLISPKLAITSPKIAPTLKPTNTIKATLISCNTHLKSFHSNLYLCFILKNFFIFRLFLPT